MAHYASTPTALAWLPLTFFLLILIASILYMRRKGYSELGSHTIVRCREGHVFTTIWIPFVSFKAVRLGMMRYQRCPIDNHWTFVVPLKESEITDEIRRIAARRHDNRIP